MLGLEQGDIRVARYLTEKLPPSLLEAKLRDIIRKQRKYLARRQGLTEERFQSALPVVPDTSNEEE